MAEEHANALEEVRRSLATSERATLQAREQMEAVGHSAAAELRECQSRGDARLAEARTTGRGGRWLPLPNGSERGGLVLSSVSLVGAAVGTGGQEFVPQPQCLSVGDSYFEQ